MGLSRRLQREIRGAEGQAVRQLGRRFIFAGGRRRGGAGVLLRAFRVLGHTGALRIGVNGSLHLRLLGLHLLHGRRILFIRFLLEAVTEQQVDQQRGHNENEYDQSGRQQIHLLLAGSPPTAPADLAAAPQRRLLLTEGTIFIGIGIFFPADGAAFHGHGRHSFRKLRCTLHNIGFPSCRQVWQRRIFSFFTLCRRKFLLLGE